MNAKDTAEKITKAVMKTIEDERSINSDFIFTAVHKELAIVEPDKGVRPKNVDATLRLTRTLIDGLRNLSKPDDINYVCAVLEDALYHLGYPRGT